MEGLNLYNAYRERAMRELKQLEEFATALLPETVISRAYYAVYYAIKAQLALLGIISKSHKQTLIEFRKNFVKEHILSSNDSKIIAKLFEWRELADYDVMWQVSADEFKKLLTQVKPLVLSILNCNIAVK